MREYKLEFGNQLIDLAELNEGIYFLKTKKFTLQIVSEFSLIITGMIKGKGLAFKIRRVIRFRRIEDRWPPDGNPLGFQNMNKPLNFFSRSIQQILRPWTPPKLPVKFQQMFVV